MEIINARYYSLDEDAVQYSDQGPVVPQGWLALSRVYILIWFSFSFQCSKVFSSQKNNFLYPF